MIGLHGIISWKETFAVKRMISIYSCWSRTLRGIRKQNIGRGGLSGQSSNSNSTNRYFTTAPILLKIYLKILRAGEESNSNSKSHHEPENAYTQWQSRWVILLLYALQK